MLSAINRLFFIIAGTLALCVVAVLAVRWAGGQQQFAEPPHAWFTISEWKVVKPKVACPPKMADESGREDLNWLRVHYTAEGWRTDCGSITKTLKEWPHPNWLLFVDSRETTNLDKLIEELVPLEKSKNFGIYTPSQVAARYLRKKAPQWVYGADPATLLRLHMYAGFWVETAFDFWPDFVMQMPGDKNTQLTEREMAELQRRKKRVIQHP